MHLQSDGSVKNVMTTTIGEREIHEGPSYVPSSSTINIWRPRSLYASVFLWISIVGGRFLAPFLEHEAGLTTTEIGTLFALPKIAYVMVSSISGNWADQMELQYPGRGRSLVMVSGVITGGIVFLFHGASRVLDNDTESVESTHFSTTLAWHGMLRVLFGASNALVFPAMDGICLDFLKCDSESSTQDYGKERLYGAISWGVANLLLSLVLDYLGFVVVYVLAVTSTVITVAVIMLFSARQKGIFRHQREWKRRNSNLETENRREGDQFQTSATATVTSFEILLRLLSTCFGFSFIIAQVTQSSGQAIVDNLVFLFFETLGSSYKVMGFTVVLTVAFEIPIFQIAPSLLKRLGPSVLIQIAAMSYVIRVIGYSFVPEGQMVYVLLLEPLHGVTFACSATAGVELLSAIVPSGSEASGQSLLQVLVGLGSVLGLFIGGYLEDVMGPRVMYRVSAFVVFIGCFIFSLALRVSGAPTSAGHQKLPQDEAETEVSTELTTMPPQARKH